MEKVSCPYAQFRKYVHEQSTIKKELWAFFNIAHHLFFQKRLDYLPSINYSPQIHVD